MVIYFVSTLILGISFSDLGVLGKYGALIFVILTNVVFLAFDILLSKMAVYYILRFHKFVEKILR